MRGIQYPLGLVVLLALARLASAWEIQTVADMDDLEGIIDTAWTNNFISKLMPPGDFDYENHIDLIAFEDGFDTNFINSLVAVTNGTNAVVMYPVEVIEITNGSGRVRHYLSAVASNPAALYTSTVSIANYPEDWIEETYGDPPGWLSGNDLDLWYSDRDPWRQHGMCDLIATSSIPDYMEMLTNAATYTSGTNTNSLLTVYSNDIAFVAMNPTAAGLDIYIHAPTNVPTLDVFAIASLLTNNWDLPVTLDHTADPILWTYYGTDSNLFFSAANATLDTDGDGLADMREVRLFGTSTNLMDTDGDGLSDALEVLTYDSNALTNDTDGDLMSDAAEIARGENPLQSPAGYAQYMTLPFSDEFEAPGVTAGNLNGQNRWVASPATQAVVQTNSSYGGTQAVEFASGTTAASAEHLIGAIGEETVWIDFYSKVDQDTISDFRDYPEIEDAPAYVASVFAMNCDGDIYAYNGTTPAWQKMTTSALTNGVYHRYTVKQDYSTKTWDFYIDSALAQSGLGFRDPATREFTIFSATGTRGGDVFCDDVSISTSKPAGIP